MPARNTAKKAAKKKRAVKMDLPLPPASDWLTTDQDEIFRRIQLAREEKYLITNLQPEQPILSTFAVQSPSGMMYQVEIRDLKDRSFSAPAQTSAPLVLAPANTRKPPSFI